MQRPRLPTRPPCQTAALAGLLVVFLGAASAQGVRPSDSPLELAEVRAVFARVDADSDGRLGRREADHGGVDAAAFDRFDADGDGQLDPEEYVVARHALLDGTRREAAADLRADAIRIQAARRARRALGQDRGPAASRSAETASSAVRSTGSRPASAEASPIQSTTGARARPEREPAYPIEVAGGLPPTLGLSRLRQAAPAAPEGPGQSLEDRARAAQDLIHARMRQRDLQRTSGVVAQASKGPGSRVGATGVERGRSAAVPSTRGTATSSGEPARRPSDTDPSRPPATGSEPARRPAPDGGPAAGRSRPTPVPPRSGGGLP